MPATPGPYHVEAGRAIVTIRGDAVATCRANSNLFGYSNVPPAISPTEADINTHFLAAAPDLLTALKLMVEHEYYEDEHLRGREFGKAIIDALRLRGVL